MVEEQLILRLVSCPNGIKLALKQAVKAGCQGRLSRHSYRYSGTGHHWEPTYSEVSLTHGFRYTSGRHGICNWDFEHNVATFSGLSIAVCW